MVQISALDSGMINIMGDLVQYHSWWGIYGLKIPRTTANKFIMLLQHAEISLYPYAHTILIPSSVSTEPTSRSVTHHSSHSFHFLLRSYHKCPTSRVHSPTVVSPSCLQIIGWEERVLVSIARGSIFGQIYTSLRKELGIRHLASLSLPLLGSTK
jgi:hypothetical protein